MADVVYKVTNAAARRLAVAPDIARIAEQVRAAAMAGTPRGPTLDLYGGWLLAQGREPATTLIVNDTPYARYVEYGTRNLRAAAMLGRAMASARSTFR